MFLDIINSALHCRKYANGKWQQSLSPYIKRGAHFHNIACCRLHPVLNWLYNNWLQQYLEFSFVLNCYEIDVEPEVGRWLIVHFQLNWHAINNREQVFSTIFSKLQKVETSNCYVTNMNNFTCFIRLPMICQCNSKLQKLPFLTLINAERIRRM